MGLKEDIGYAEDIKDTDETEDVDDMEDTEDIEDIEETEDMENLEHTEYTEDMGIAEDKKEVILIILCNVVMCNDTMNIVILQCYTGNSTNVELLMFPNSYT